ncbi:MAG: sugar transferase, partial [Bdellovibrionales bacterium]|nr:sugar transferase [Bdellovibrionales bacterium]
ELSPMFASKTIVIPINALSRARQLELLTNSPRQTGTIHGAGRGRSRSTSDRPYESLKEVMDFAVASFLLLALAPLMIVIAAVIRATSAGPVIFRQIRLTKGGRPFVMFKFRTMSHDAESSTGAVWAVKNDPRVTSVGRLLRKTRLDELPQLLNVLNGDMSLIGPRPERPEIADELAKVLPKFERRLAVKAGITGLAQTANGYADSVSDYRRKLALDIMYVKSRSIALDCIIAAKTVLVIITGKGAQ